MAIQTLPRIALSRDSRLTERARARSIRLGDGYTQTVADGPNAIERRYSAVWRAVLHAEADQLITFFTARAGVEAFHFTLIDERLPRSWRCDEWSRRRVSATRSDVEAQFTEAIGIGL